MARAASPRWYVELLLIIGLLCLNPLLYGMRVPLNLTPDAISYLSFADTAVTAGKLYLSGWGHVDTTTILPPLYPSLIAMLDMVRPDPVANALAISAVSMLLVSGLTYFYVRRYAPPLIAAVAVALIQLNFYYVYFATMAYTEALFLLLLMATFCLAVYMVARPKPKIALGLALGVFASLVYLARQVGLIVGPFLALWLLIDALSRQADARRMWFRVPVAVFFGWGLVVGGYAALLYYQTGRTIVAQSYRMHSYVVTSSDPAVLDNIARLKQLEGLSYVDLYRNRRYLRALLPDGSEMLEYVMPAESAALSPQAVNSVWPNAMTYITQLWRNISDNITHFANQLGGLLLAALALASVSPFLLRPNRLPWWPRLLLPGFIIVYTLGVSTMTAFVDRYFTVLLPLAMAQVALELGVVHYWWSKRQPNLRLPVLVLSLALALLLLFMPRTVLRVPPHARGADPQVVMKQSLIGNEPVFALQPIQAYLAGGSFRIMPNDTLDKVILYARHTGVRWILVPRQPERSFELQFYSLTGWLHDPQALMKRTDVLRFRNVVKKTSVTQEYLLFEILPES